MGCILEDGCGNCTVAEDGVEIEGQEDGICVCSSDENPADSCSSYESDWACRDCGVDLNVGECECDEEDDE